MTFNKEFEEVVGTFHQTDEGEIRVKVGVAKSGQPFVDLRHWWLPPGAKDEELVPTKRGVRLHAENLEALIAALVGGDEILRGRNT